MHGAPVSPNLVLGRAGALGCFSGAGFPRAASGRATFAWRELTVLLCLRGPRVNLRPCCPICLICPTELCCLDSGYVIPLIRGLECGVPYVLATGSQIRPSSGCSAHCGQEAPPCPCPVAGSVGQALCPGTSGWAGDAQGLWASLLSPGLRPSTCLSGVFAALASQKSTLPPPRVPQGCLRSAASVAGAPGRGLRRRISVNWAFGFVSAGK